MFCNQAVRCLTEKGLICLCNLPMHICNTCTQVHLFSHPLIDNCVEAKASSSQLFLAVLGWTSLQQGWPVRGLLESSYTHRKQSPRMPSPITYPHCCPQCSPGCDTERSSLCPASQGQLCARRFPAGLSVAFSPCASM